MLQRRVTLLPRASVTRRWLFTRLLLCLPLGFNPTDVLFFNLRVPVAGAGAFALGASSHVLVSSSVPCLWFPVCLVFRALAFPSSMFIESEFYCYDRVKMTMKIYIILQMDNFTNV